MIIKDFLPLAEILVKELSSNIDADYITMKDAEEKIVEFINKIGHLLLDKVMSKIKEPILENRIIIDDKKAYFHGNQNLRFKDRFGQEIVRSRRRYKVEGSHKGYYPLDEKLGLDKCTGFSPLMTYFLAFFGGCEAFEPGAEKLSKALGFNVSATAIQKNTEMTGKRLSENPLKNIPASKQNAPCDIMVVEIDGTMSPQIAPKEGVTGYESLKQPTEYKECNLIAVQKFNKNKEDKKIEHIDEWVGALYGPRKVFEPYVRQTGLKMGQLNAKEVVFIADGALHNWDIQIDNYPEATAILDFYHATEHLAEFCELFKKKDVGKKAYKNWYTMLYEGEIIQVLEEMRQTLDEKVSNRDAALKHYNYFEKNKLRMEYDIYKEKGYPIGSGLIEGKCKLVVGRRFKGNGMRWKKADNDSVLKVRLAIFNNTLAQNFIPKPRSFKFASAF